MTLLSAIIIAFDFVLIAELAHKYDIIAPGEFNLVWAPFPHCAALKNGSQFCVCPDAWVACFITLVQPALTGVLQNRARSQLLCSRPLHYFSGRCFAAFLALSYNIIHLIFLELYCCSLWQSLLSVKRHEKAAESQTH